MEISVYKLWKTVLANDIKQKGIEAWLCRSWAKSLVKARISFTVHVERLVYQERIFLLFKGCNR